MITLHGEAFGMFLKIDGRPLLRLHDADLNSVCWYEITQTGYVFINKDDAIVLETEFDSEYMTAVVDVKVQGDDEDEGEGFEMPSNETMH